MKRFLIIADDITGANDTGVMLARLGIPVIVTLKEIEEGPISCVINTESRSLNPEEAYKLISGLDINFEGFDFTVKKVDSTLRGNIAHEILAVDMAYKPELILFVPALPELGRTTKGGIHMLNGTPVSKTEIGSDPKTPVREDNLKNILQAVYKETVTHFSVEDIEESRPDFSRGRVFSCDALINRHMQKTVAAALETGKRILWVGSAGIVDSLLQTIHSLPPAMALVASISDTTRQQVKFAEEKGVPLVIIPWQCLVSGNYNEYIQKGAYLLQKGADIIVLPSSSYDRTEFEKSPPNTSRQIQEAMGVIGAAILEKVKVSGVFLTGGDTAIGFLNKIGAAKFSIVSEVLMGVPLMKAMGTKYDAMKIITKAGAFGQPDTIFYCLRKLKEI
jgi:uncharacterized protein YgbK (DUF1537 family)